MLGKMFTFEWRYYTRQPSFYVSSLIFFALGFLGTSLDRVSMGGGNILKNGPYMTGFVMAILGVFCMILVVNFVAGTAMRNKNTGMSEILYCKPINALSYQLGRFLGAVAVVIAVFTMAPLGHMAGGFMPWVNEARIGPVNVSIYLTTFFYLSLPTILLFSCLFYTLAIRMNSMMAVYLAAVGFYMLYEVSSDFFASPDARSWAAMIDPFALQTFAELTRYWTVFEKNNTLLSFSSDFMLNRLLWMGLGVSVLAVFGRLSRSLTLTQTKVVKKVSKKQIALASDTGPMDNSIHHNGYIKAGWQHYLTRTRFEIKQVIFDPPFFILCALLFFVLLVVMFEPKGMFGGTLLPLTQSMIQMIRGTMGMLSLIIITYYSGEIIWRERESGMGDIIDSMPVANLSYWLSKLTALWAVLILLLAFAMGVTIIFQIGRGYAHIEYSQYLTTLFYFTALPWMMLSALAFFLQVLSPNKFAGMLFFVLFILSGLVMEPIGLGHNMFQFGSSPELTYTDLNKYGGALESHSWYMLYWGALSVVMSIVGYGLWQRGPVQGLKTRLRGLNYQIGSKGKLALASAAVVFVLSGANIIYNTRVLNNYTTDSDNNVVMVDYEKRYRRYYKDPVPVIIKLNASVDIFPEQRKIVADAKIEVINNSDKAINRFLVTIMGFRTSNMQVELEGGKLVPSEKDDYVYWFEFDKPLQPGEKRTGHYAVTRQQEGFVDINDTIQIVENGTFINNTELFPRFGYQPFLQLQDPVERELLGLEPLQRFHKLEDSEYYGQTIFGPESGHLEFEATVSTSADQVAIAPGYLQKEWSENNRRYFHYKMDAPIENYFSFMSGRYETLKTSHKGVSIEIYYHKTHGINVPRMQQAVMDSIDYYSENFGPYQHKQARIIEFPGYRDFAQSFPNTIAFSERIGFITDLSDESAIDQVYYVTAHEMAHQWWGGQVDGANVQGSTVISETLAQYSALMLTRKKYGDKKLRTILRFELDRYLRGRTLELVEELPLMRVENQPYIHYRKGAVVVMSLIDLLGEEKMNHALAGFLAEFKFSENPYPTTIDLLGYINREASEKEQIFIASMFSEISLYDLKAQDFAVEELDNDQYEVTFTIDARRFEADGSGMETEAGLSEMIDVGLFLDNPDKLSGSEEGSVESKLVYLQKHRISSGENIIKVIVPEKPVFAGIDPFVKLIDRDSADNIIKL